MDDDCHEKDAAWRRARGRYQAGRRRGMAFKLRQRQLVPPGAGWVFNPPPGWPAPPPGWQPPDGWQPDPSWPPPPSDWQFWRPEIPAEPPPPTPPPPPPPDSFPVPAGEIHL